MLRCFSTENVTRGSLCLQKPLCICTREATSHTEGGTNAGDTYEGNY